MIRRRSVSAVSLLFLLSIFVFLTATPASATPIEQKRAKAREIAAKLEKLYPQVDMAVERYNQATERLATVKQQIAENTHMLKVAAYNLEVANDQLKARAVNMYKTRGVGFVDVLFSTRSFDELVTQLDLMERLGRSDVDTVKSIAAYKRDIKDREIKLEADKKTAAELVDQAAAEKSKIIGLQDKLERMQSGVKAEIKRLQEQAAAAAKAAAQQSWGSAPDLTGPTVDPGGPGHPEVVALAQRELGDPYVFGAAGPSSFDCSGLTMYCYAQIGIGLIHGATYQYRASKPVPLNALLPGDLVFFGSPSYCHHVGIYAGGGQMIHAPHTGTVVQYGSISGAFAGGRF